MQAVLERAEPLSETLWRGLLAGRPVDTPERRAGLEKELKDKTDLIADGAVRRYYEQLFKDKLYQAFRPALRSQWGREPPIRAVMPAAVSSARGRRRRPPMGISASNFSWSI